MFLSVQNSSTGHLVTSCMLSLLFHSFFYLSQSTSLRIWRYWCCCDPYYYTRSWTCWSVLSGGHFWFWWSERLFCIVVLYSFFFCIIVLYSFQVQNIPDPDFPALFGDMFHWQTTQICCLKTAIYMFPTMSLQNVSIQQNFPNNAFAYFAKRAASPNTLLPHSVLWPSTPPPYLIFVTMSHAPHFKFFSLVFLCFLVKDIFLWCVFLVSNFYRTQVSLVRSMGLVVSNWLTDWLTDWLSIPCWDLTDVTLADEDTNSIIIDNANRTFQRNVAMQVTQAGGKICN